jgi:hypothetical protein
MGSADDWALVAGAVKALKAVAGLSLPVLLGGVAGGLAGAVVGFLTWWSDVRSRTLRELLIQGLEILKLREAYILDGGDFTHATLADNLKLKTESSLALFLRQVEVRAVLDPPVWNVPEQQRCYGFVQGRRAWIVRNAAQSETSYAVLAQQPIHPALLSSQAMEELCGWIERVASVKPRWLFLSRHAREALWPLLVCVAGEDRIAVLGPGLTRTATSFLRWYYRKYRTPRGAAKFPELN